MRKLLFLIVLSLSLAMPASALELSAPQVPEAGEQLMPERTDSFSEGLSELLRKGMETVRPDLSEALRTSTIVLCAGLLLTLGQGIAGCSGRVTEIAATAYLVTLLLRGTDSLIRLGADTVTEITQYGKLLLPVMTAGLAAQGSAATSAALYAGTAAFDLLLSSFISGLLVPLIYVFLILSAANSAIGQDILKKMRDFIKWLVSWILKTLLTVFTTYISITGVVSGTTDAVALKATKMTISSVVPVVGGILSDASEAVLVSAAAMKNAAGVYGILAILAVFLAPFLKIGVHYAVLKVTAAICSLFAEKTVSGLVEDFATAMGLLLAMTGASCVLLLISTICFMKGAG